MNSRDHNTPKLKRKKYLPLLHQYALQFNGTDEYLTRALPTNLLTGTTSDFTSAGSRPTGWSVGSGETWNQTGITGSTSTKVLKLNGTNAYAVYGGLTVGKKYKLKIRWYGDNSLRIGSTSTGTQYYTSMATTQWNTKYITIVATSANLYFSIASGTVYLDLWNFAEDWKLDLNESYELIKHSMNRDMEQTLGAELSSGTVTIGKRYIVTAGTVEGNAQWSEFTATTTATTLDANNKVREIPNQVSNHVFTANVDGWTAEGGTLSHATTCARSTVTVDGQETRFITINSATNLIVGKRYRATYNLRANRNIDAGCQVNNNRSRQQEVTAILNPNITTSYQTYSFEWTQQLDSPFETRGVILNNGDYLEVDNIHVYELIDWRSNGNHTANLTLADKYAGTGSLYISASGAGNSCSNYVSLPSAQIETLVSGNKYTKEFWAKVDPSSLSYGATNLCTNGEFTVNTNGWSSINGAVLSVDSNTLKISVQNAFGMAGYAVTTIIGRVYKVTYRQNIDTGASQRQFWVGTSLNNSSVYVNTTSLPATGWQSYTFYFVATSTTSYIQMGISGQFLNHYIDDVVIVESNEVAPTLTAQLGTKSVTVTPSISAFTKGVLNFECSASEVGQDLKLYLNGAGSVFIDNLSLTQAYDYAVIGNGKPPIGARTRAWFQKRTSSGAISKGWDVGFVSSVTDSFFTRISDGVNEVSLSDIATFGVWLNILSTFNRTDKATLYFNNTKKVESSITALGKVDNDVSFEFGARTGGSTWIGLLGSSQIIRFNNISQSDFNPNTYKIGQTISGGGAEVVLWIDPRNGSSIANMLQDYSGNGNNLSAVNMDLTNRVVIRK